MSGSEPGEMAPESLKVVVFPKFDMHIYTPELTSSELGKAIEEYDIPLDLHPCIPPPGMTMNKLPSRYIGLYIEKLEQGDTLYEFKLQPYCPSVSISCASKVTSSLLKTRPEVLNRSFSDILHLEDIHVARAHLEKNQTRLRTCTNISQDNVLRSWRRRHRFNVTSSQ
ncbi:hypothetical protein Tco_1480207 [Tanacetum coccineum]